MSRQNCGSTVEESRIEKRKSPGSSWSGRVRGEGEELSGSDFNEYLALDPCKTPDNAESSRKDLD